jgi:hypothetical protein
VQSYSWELRKRPEAFTIALGNEEDAVPRERLEKVGAKSVKDVVFESK